MVLLAAAAIVVALVAMLLAFMQLGFHPSVAEPPQDHLRDVERTLERELLNATATANTTGWSDRYDAVTAVRDGLQPALDSLNRSALARTTLIQVTYNDSLAAAWRGGNCPGGPARQFGSCGADRGVVVQERAGESHVLAVAFDVRVVGDDSRLVAHTVIEHP
jgi:hypothetical protein